MRVAFVRHRRLVNLGRAFLVLGPILAASHIIIDALGNDTWWTSTIVSYGTATIVTIIGAALAWRTPPTERNARRSAGT